jgi:hypothetical protein
VTDRRLASGCEKKDLTERLLFSSTLSISTLAIQESTPGRSGKDGEAPSGNLVKSGGEVDITKLLSLLCPCHQALSWLPFSCYLVAGKMAKVESI